MALDMLTWLEEDSSIQATRKPKQPDDNSTTTKRPFSQTSSVPHLFQKKPKPNRRVASPPTTPAKADVEAMRTAPRNKELDGGKSEGPGTWW